MIDPNQLYTELEVAEKLRISRSTVRQWFKPVRLSARGTRYRATDVAAYIESKANPPKSR